MTKANIPYNKICEHCQKEFVAQKRTTRYCSLECNRKAYKQNQRELIHEEVSEKEALKSAAYKSNQLLEEIAGSVKSIQTQLQIANKPYLSLREASVLLNISRASMYRLAEKGIVPTYDIGLDVQFVKRSDIDNLFETPKTENT